MRDLTTYRLSLFGHEVAVFKVSTRCAHEEQRPKLEASGGGIFEREFFGFDT